MAIVGPVIVRICNTTDRLERERVRGQVTIFNEKKKEIDLKKKLEALKNGGGEKKKKKESNYNSNANTSEGTTTRKEEPSSNETTSSQSHDDFMASLRRKMREVDNLEKR